MLQLVWLALILLLTMLAPSWLGGPIVYIYTVNNIVKIYSKGVSFDFLDSLNCFKTNNSAYFNLSSALAKGIWYFFTIELKIPRDRQIRLKMRTNAPPRRKKTANMSVSKSHTVKIYTTKYKLHK